MLRRHSKIVAFLLLLAFSQTGGMRLWMHHWLHESSAASKTADGADASESMKVLCNCFDEAMLPLEQTPFFTLEIPVQQATGLMVAPAVILPSTEKIFCSLRGPPSHPFCS